MIQSRKKKKKKKKKKKPKDPLITAQTNAYQLRLINKSEDAIRRSKLA